MARSVLAGLALALLMGLGFGSDAALDVEAELAVPEAKLLVVEFFATWCQPCMEAVPRWETLRDKYARKGLRFVVVAVKDDADRCTDVPWKPDRIICDTEGALAKRFGVKQLPAAFLWNWQGHLLANKVHVDEVEEKIDGWMREIPRVDIEVELETRRAGVSARGLRRLIASELSVEGKLLVVASEEERQRLRTLARRSSANFADESMQCDLGKEVSANSLLQATVTRGARQLRLGLLSAESHCRTRSVFAPWDRRNPSRSVSQAVTKLLTSLRRSTLQRPVALDVVRSLSHERAGSAGEADLDQLLADAERREREAEVARALAEARQREQEAREEKARAARLKALNARWAKLDKLAAKSVLPTAQRARLLSAFVTEYPTDNPYLERAKSYIARLGLGQEPVTAPDDMVEVPGGDFLMGCNEKVDSACDADERPGRREYLARFLIDRTEVTVDAYAECVRDGLCSPLGLRIPFFEGKEQPAFAKYCNWRRPGRGAHPLNCVDWSSANTYCAYRGRRLPTEAEWEKAARGTDGRKYPWGNDEPTCKMAVFDDGRTTDSAGSETDGCGRDLTWPAASLPAGASPYGALHMTGNVWEWTANWDTPDKTRIGRGGGWINVEPARLRASNRYGISPLDRSYYLGFRCALSP